MNGLHSRNELKAAHVAQMAGGRSAAPWRTPGGQHVAKLQASAREARQECALASRKTTSGDADSLNRIDRVSPTNKGVEVATNPLIQRRAQIACEERQYDKAEAKLKS